MQTPSSLHIPMLVSALMAAAVLTGCGGDAPPAAPQAGAPMAPTVTVITVRPEAVPLVSELPGRTSPYLVAEIRPQVTGIIKARPFSEGGEVKAGQLLYQIDASTYEATHASANAALARAEANLHAARLKAQRYAELAKVDAVSQQANDEASTAVKQAEADVASANATINKARIDLGFTRVSSPISGRIGRSTVTPGALVTANQTQSLATVQQLNPIFVDLTQSSADLLRLRRDLAEGRLKHSGNDTVAVRLVLEDDSLYALEGKLAFSEVTVDPGTGSVTLRALFPNPRGQLLPGMYVRARLTQGVMRDAVLVPHAAVSRNPRGDAEVMVVNAENKVETRPVKAMRSRDDKWVISEGLSAGERVIVEGLQRVRAGASVKAEEAATTTPSPTAPTKD